MSEFEVEKLAEFDNHRLVSFLRDSKSGLRGFIAIHRGGLVNPAFGATRFWEYASEIEALKDALKLSKMMSYKSALAGLKYGGGKAVIMANRAGPQKRRSILTAYAEQINYLGGKFITGTDMGLEKPDLKFMRKKSPHFVGLRVDPAYFTGLGLLCAIEVCLNEIFGRDGDDIAGRSFAIEGLGKVGMNLLGRVYDSASKIYVSDINSEKIRQAKRAFPKIQGAAPEEIHKMAVDVYCPCAVSSSLNRESVPELHCKIVAGGANNQLENENIGGLLYESGILYAPDYVINAGGLISVVSEFEDKKCRPEKIKNHVFKIKNTLRRIFDESSRKRKAANFVANRMAEDILNTYA